MDITPGPFAPTVTQHVSSAGIEDRYGDAPPTFTDRQVKALAEYPGGSGSGRATSQEVDDVLTADRVILLNLSVSVTEADEFTVSDGHRYRVQGVPGIYLNPITGTSIQQVNLRRITTST